MQEEKSIQLEKSPKRAKDHLKKKYKNVREIYDQLLRSALDSAKNNYYRGKVEIFKRVLEYALKKEQEKEFNYREYFVGPSFDDVPNSSHFLK